MHEQASFGVPLQLSSFPCTQVSAAEGVMLHAPQVPAAVHVSLPDAHLPARPPWAHVRVAPRMQVQPSFGVPLQVSSFAAVQVSLAAGLMLQAPHVPSVVHACCPAAQLPRAPAAAHVRTAPELHGQPSLAVPLQLSSFPRTQLSLALAFTLQSPQTRSVPQVCIPAAQLPNAPPSAQERCSPAVHTQPGHVGAPAAPLSPAAAPPSPADAPPVPAEAPPPAALAPEKPPLLFAPALSGPPVAPASAQLCDASQDLPLP